MLKTNSDDKYSEILYEITEDIIKKADFGNYVYEKIDVSQ